jgi:hypothetical protein
MGMSIDESGPDCRVVPCPPPPEGHGADRRYLSLAYTEPSGKEHVAIFDLAQNAVQGTLKFISEQSGSRIDYQPDPRYPASPR